jgi:hypothetical protein
MDKLAVEKFTTADMKAFQHGAACGITMMRYTGG